MCARARKGLYICVYTRAHIRERERRACLSASITCVCMHVHVCEPGMCADKITDGHKQRHTPKSFASTNVMCHMVGKKNNCEFIAAHGYILGGF